jgi:hypothetical protein
MRTLSTSSAAHHSSRSIAVALMLTLSLVAATPVAAVPSASGKNAAVIPTWNQVAINTLANTVVPPGGSPTHFIYFAFTHLAMHNAVNGITGKYSLYQWDEHTTMSASPEAAAAAAAHRILTNYFPAQAATLNAQLAASLAAISSGARKDRGVAFGVRAADHLIALRVGDGRHAVVPIPPALEPGDWKPTPPAFLPFTGTAWIGGVKPLALDSHDHFDPGAPPAINSATYVEEYNEVKAFGKVDSVVRTPEQTQTALFFSDAGIGPMQAALRAFATNRRLDISDSARLFAAVETSIADTAGTIWNAKLQYMWWRPVTAIQEGDTDGNDLTVGDPTWLPRIGTPPYPDWPSGLCGVVGSVTTVLTRLYGMVDLTITSTAAGETRYFAFKEDITGPAIDARVWGGIHFRTADEVSVDIGTNVANYVLDRYFAPAH